MLRCKDQAGADSRCQDFTLESMSRFCMVLENVNKAEVQYDWSHFRQIAF